MPLLRTVSDRRNSIKWSIRGTVCFSWWNYFFFSVSRRLKSVKNIQKITKSMKMVSAAKYAKAEKELKLARPYGTATTGIIIYFICLSKLNVSFHMSNSVYLFIQLSTRRLRSKLLQRASRSTWLLHWLPTEACAVPFTRRSSRLLRELWASKRMAWRPRLFALVTSQSQCFNVPTLVIFSSRLTISVRRTSPSSTHQPLPTVSWALASNSIQVKSSTTDSSEHYFLL